MDERDDSRTTGRRDFLRKLGLGAAAAAAAPVAFPAFNPYAFDFLHRDTPPKPQPSTNPKPGTGG